MCVQFNLVGCGLTSTPSSRNLTVPTTPGYTDPHDPAYAAIPLDSRQPPAPIDPSSEFDATSVVG